MKRLRPLSQSLALLAATNMALAPVYIPMAHAEGIQAGSGSIQTDDAVVTDTDTSLTLTTTVDVSDDEDDEEEEEVVVSSLNVKNIIKGLTSSDINEVQARYKELLALIKTEKAKLKTLKDADDIADKKAEIANLNNLAKAFKAIIKGFEDSGVKTVVRTETTTDPDTGDVTTRTTYSDGSYTETVVAGNKTDYGDDGYGNSDDEDDSGGGGGGDFLKQMLENPMVQGMIVGLLQKLMSGGLGSLQNLLSGLFGTNDVKNGDTLLGKVCSGGKCNVSEYNTPSPQSKMTKEEEDDTDTTPSTTPTGGRLPGRI